MNEQDARNTDYRLHHLPFWMMWVAAFGVGWLGIFVAAILWNDIRYDSEMLVSLGAWLNAHARWLDGILIGAAFGAFLVLVQGWLIRWRYGFVPRFWRITTFIGAILSGTLFSEFIYANGYYDSYGAWFYPNPILPLFVWLSGLSLVQTVALWPVVRRAWLYPLAGFGAAAIGAVATYIDLNGVGQMYGIFFGSMAQAMFSGAAFLWLMRDYRVEAVPKRDEKAKGRYREYLHPMSFMGLWSLGHLFGWVSLLSSVLILMMIQSAFPILQNFLYWITSFTWLMTICLGLIVGGMTSLAQAWLIPQQSGYRPRAWLWLGTAAWILASFGLYEIMRYNAYSMPNIYWYGAMYLAWFALPPMIQSFALGRDLTGAWLYGLAGVVSAVLALFVYRQMDWTSGANFYAIIFGSVLQAILTGAAFLSIAAQNRQEEEALATSS